MKNGQIFAHKSTARGGLDLDYLDETSRRKVSLRERADIDQQIGKKLKHFTDYASKETLGQVHAGGFLHHSIRINPDGTSTPPCQLCNAERKQRITRKLAQASREVLLDCETSRNHASARFLDVQGTARCTVRRGNQSRSSPSLNDEKGHAKIQREISFQRFDRIRLRPSPRHRKPPRSPRYLPAHRKRELCRLQHVAIQPVQAQEPDGLHQIMVRA